MRDSYATRPHESIRFSVKAISFSSSSGKFWWFWLALLRYPGRLPFWLAIDQVSNNFLSSNIYQHKPKPPHTLAARMSMTWWARTHLNWSSQISWRLQKISDWEQLQWATTRSLDQILNPLLFSWVLCQLASMILCLHFGKMSSWGVLEFFQNFH